MDNELKREIILDNFKNPFNKTTKDDPSYIKVNSNNESCIDNINLYVKIEDNIIKDITFDGEACAISTASTSIMIQNLIGKTIEEVEDYIKDFSNMLTDKEYDEEKLGDAVVFDETYKQANRKTCVTLPYKGIESVIEKIKEGE